jgi:serine-type D-Ala-D-Ala carboxypeptidase/endopeptidase
MLNRCPAIALHLLLPIILPAAMPARETIDAIVQPHVDEGKIHSLVIGLVDPDGRRIMAYARPGAADVDGQTLYEIGSITKGFTGLLLAQMVGAGEIGLEDPVSRHLPALAKLQDDGQPVTLLHLATHRSGLPRMPGNFRPKDRADPYADYSIEQLYACLAEQNLPAPPGRVHTYSNLGAGLLGHVLAQRAGMSYEQLIIERICRPLGMNDTRMTLDKTQRQRLAPGHDAAGFPAANWDMPTLAGAGALRSTADDMLSFIEAQVGLRQTVLADAISLSQRRQTEIGDGGGMALGWHIAPGGGTIWHNGQTGGYRSYTAFNPRQRFGIIILASTATPLVDRIGEQCLRKMSE